jgi:hypothetical protein
MARKTTAIVKAREAKAIATTISPDEALSEWLAEPRSPNTRVAYYRDLVDFCKTVFNADYVKFLSGSNLPLSSSPIFANLRPLTLSQVPNSSLPSRSRRLCRLRRHCPMAGIGGFGRE